jgi:hypothetical protein
MPVPLWVGGNCHMAAGQLALAYMMEFPVEAQCGEVDAR